jgi:hypothetical protein
VGQNLYIAGNSGAPKANWTAAIGEFFLSTLLPVPGKIPALGQTKKRLFLK